MVLHSSFQDFVLFLHIHMALADGVLHPDEERVILNKMTRLFPAEGNPKKKFDLALKEYQGVKPGETMNIVKDSFKHFSQVKSNQIYKIYTDMYDIVNADGKIEESERLALEALKEIIDLHAEARTK